MTATGSLVFSGCSLNRAGFFMHTQKSFSGVVFFSQELAAWDAHTLSAGEKNALSFLRAFALYLSALAPGFVKFALKLCPWLQCRRNYQLRRGSLSSARGYRSTRLTFCVLFSSVAQFGPDNFLMWRNLYLQNLCLVPVWASWLLKRRCVDR